MKNVGFLGCLAVIFAIIAAPQAHANAAVGALSDKAEKAKRVGSAALITTDGYILSSSALVGRDDEMFFTLSDGDQALSASLIATNEDLGVALLKLDLALNDGPSPLVFSNSPITETRIISSLTRDGRGLSTTDGAVSNTLVKDTSGARFLKHNAMIPKEGYGGVLANECGEAVGVNVVNPFLSVRSARRMPEPEDAIYAADMDGVIRFLDGRGVSVLRSAEVCLSAEEKAIKLERQSEQDQEDFDKKSGEKQVELDRVQKDLAEKEKTSVEAKERAEAAEKDAQNKAAEVERLRRDRTASEIELAEAEEDAEAARKAAEQAAVDAADRAQEIQTLTDQQDALQRAIDASKKRQKMTLIGGGVGVLLLILLAGLLLWRRSKALAIVKAEKAAAVEKLNESFSDIECRGQDQNNAPHAFRVSGSSLLKAPRGLVVGRQPQSSDILINHPEISRAHLRISLKEGVVYVEDLGSTNGSSVNMAPLMPNTPISLRSGDALAMGKITFQVRFLDA